MIQFLNISAWGILGVEIILAKGDQGKYLSFHNIVLLAEIQVVEKHFL